MTRFAALALSALLVAPAAAAAQSFRLSGLVTDPSGAILPGVTVTATLDTREQQTSATVRTDRNGQYTFTDLRPGTYTVAAVLPGFANLEVSVPVTSDAERNLELRIGSLQETITIVAGAPPREPVRRAAPPAPPAAAAARPAPGTVRVGGNLKAPMKTADVAPIYPAGLAATKVGGVVVLEATIDQEGRVREVKTVRSPEPELTRAATDAISQWEFTPTLLNGAPVAVVMTATFNFSAN